MMHQSDTMSEKCGNLRTSMPAYPFVLYEQHPNTDRSRTWICRSDDHLIAVAFSLGGFDRQEDRTAEAAFDHITKRLHDWRIFGLDEFDLENGRCLTSAKIERLPGFDQIIRTLRLYRRFELEDLADLGSLEFPFILYERRGDDARGWVYPDASDLRIQAMAKTDTISWSMKPEEALHTIVKGADEWKMYRLDETDAKLEALPDYKTLIDGIRRAHRENLRWEKRAAKTS